MFAVILALDSHGGTVNQWSSCHHAFLSCCFCFLEAWIASDCHIVPACSSDVDDDDKEEEILDVLNNEDKDDNDDDQMPTENKDSNDD